MSKFQIVLTDTYDIRLSEIEDFIFESSHEDITQIEKFINDHDRVLEFLKENSNTPAPHPQTGDQSWPFGEGRYRLFFKVSGSKIFLLDLIDNRMSNLKIYPNNKLPTYNEE